MKRSTLTESVYVTDSVKSNEFLCFLLFLQLYIIILAIANNRNKMQPGIKPGIHIIAHKPWLTKYAQGMNKLPIAIRECILRVSTWRNMKSLSQSVY